MSKSHNGSEKQQDSPVRKLLERMIYAGAFFGSLGLLYALLYWTTGKMLQAPPEYFLPLLILNLCNIVASVCLLIGAWLLRTNNNHYFRVCYGLCLAALAVKFIVFMSSPYINFGWAFLASVLFVSTINALLSQLPRGKRGK